MVRIANIKKSIKNKEGRSNDMVEKNKEEGNKLRKSEVENYAGRIKRRNSRGRKRHNKGISKTNRGNASSEVKFGNLQP